MSGTKTEGREAVIEAWRRKVDAGHYTTDDEMVGDAVTLMRSAPAERVVVPEAIMRLAMQLDGTLGGGTWAPWIVSLADVANPARDLPAGGEVSSSGVETAPGGLVARAIKLTDDDAPHGTIEWRRSASLLLGDLAKCAPEPEAKAAPSDTSERDLEEAIEEREEMEERVNLIAVALGLSEKDQEWSNCNDVGARCVERAEELQAKTAPESALRVAAGEVLLGDQNCTTDEFAELLGDLQADLDAAPESEPTCKHCREAGECKPDCAITHLAEEADDLEQQLERWKFRTGKAEAALLEAETKCLTTSHQLIESHNVKRSAAQALVEEIGAPGPESITMTVARAVGELRRLREKAEASDGKKLLRELRTWMHGDDEAETLIENVGEVVKKIDRLLEAPAEAEDCTCDRQVGENCPDCYAPAFDKPEQPEAGDDGLLRTLLRWLDGEPGLLLQRNPDNRGYQSGCPANPEAFTVETMRGVVASMIGKPVEPTIEIGEIESWLEERRELARGVNQ